jgi:arylsulfatase A-like enzyme
MVRSNRYKYCVYSHGRQRESLVDMRNDPGELVNQARNPAFKEALAQHRAYLKEHAEKTGDTLALALLDPAYRPPTTTRGKQEQ